MQNPLTTGAKSAKLRKLSERKAHRIKKSRVQKKSKKMKKVLDKLEKLWYDNQAVSKEKPHTKASQKNFLKKLLKST